MGNNSSRQVTAQDKAILDLKNQRDKLHQYQKRITVLTDRETQIAKQMLAQGDKKRALLALRRKKYQESLLSKTDGQLEQLEKLTSSVEFALIQKDVLFGLQQGTKVLKEIHAEMGGIEHVEKLMGETADAIAYQKVCLHCPSSVYLVYAIPSLRLTAGVCTGSQRDAGWQDIQPG
jgi:charged multivesicular body protein 6